MRTIGTCHIMMNFRNITLSERRRMQKHTLLYYPTYIIASLMTQRASLLAERVKNLPAMQETHERLLRYLGQEDSPGEGNGNPLQYSCLENPTDRGAWQAPVQRVAKNQT